MRAIEELRERQFAAAVENELPEPLYVFSFDTGVSPWRPDYLSLAYGRLSNREYRLHDLRHYHATQLLAAGPGHDGEQTPRPHQLRGHAEHLRPLAC